MRVRSLSACLLFLINRLKNFFCLPSSQGIRQRSPTKSSQLCWGHPHELKTRNRWIGHKASATVQFVDEKIPSLDSWCRQDYTKAKTTSLIAILHYNPIDRRLLWTSTQQGCKPECIWPAMWINLRMTHLQMKRFLFLALSNYNPFDSRTIEEKLPASSASL